MTTEELSTEQLDELRDTYYHQLVDTGEDEELTGSIDIPNDVLFNHYAGVSFTKDDFFCSMDI